MIYDTSNTIEAAKAETYFKHLVKGKKIIEIINKRKKRSISQNSYLHLILSAFGLKFGYTLEETKQQIFKEHINSDLFYEGEKEGVVKIKSWRSSADLDTKEMTIAINRFLDFSSKLGYLLPDPSNLIYIQQLEREVKNAQQYL